MAEAQQQSRSGEREAIPREVRSDQVVGRGAELVGQDEHHQPGERRSEPKKEGEDIALQPRGLHAPAGKQRREQDPEAKHQVIGRANPGAAQGKAYGQHEQHAPSPEMRHEDEAEARRERGDREETDACQHESSPPPGQVGA